MHTILRPHRNNSTALKSNSSLESCITMSDLRGLGSGYTYTVHFGIVAVYGVVIMTSLSLNSALFTMYRKGALRKAPLNAMMLSLAVADMVSSIGIIPFIAFSPIVLRNVDHVLADLLCTIAVDRFIFWLGNIASVMTIGLICVCRHVIVNHSLTVWQRLIRTKLAKAVMVAIPWIVALVVKVPSLSTMQFDACTTKCHRLSMGIDNGIYILATVGLAYIVPVGFMCFILVTIIRTIRHENNRHDSNSTSFKSQRRLALIISVFLVTFFIWWTPYTFFLLLSAFSDIFAGEEDEYYSRAKVMYFVTLPALFNSIVNPIVIGMKSNDFRQQIDDDFNVVLVPRSRSLFPTLAIYSETQA